MTDRLSRLLFPVLPWGALRCAPWLFSALLLAAALARAQTSTWDEPDIRRTRTDTPACESAGDGANDLSSEHLILAVREAGLELLVLETETLALRARCRLPQALQDTPLRSADGRYVYAAATQGWVLRLDLHQPGKLLGLRTGLALSGLALSADGHWLLASHTQPHGLVLLDAGLNVVRSYRNSALTGGATSAASGVWLAQARRSFVVAFDTLPELWELSYDPAAEPIHDGLVHDYRMGEAIATAGFLGVRRTPLPHPLRVVLADAPLRHLLGVVAHPTATEAQADVEVINMDIRRRITTRTLPGQPAAWAGTAFMSGATPWLALPLLPEGRVVLMEGSSWRLHPELLSSLRGVSAVRSHAAAAQLWLHATHAAPSDTLLLVDKEDFRLVATLRETDRRWNTVGFSSGGRVAVLSSRGAQGEIRLLDTRTLRELRRAPLPQVEAVFALDGPAP